MYSLHMQDASCLVYSHDRRLAVLVFTRIRVHACTPCLEFATFTEVSCLLTRNRVWPRIRRSSRASIFYILYPLIDINLPLLCRNKSDYKQNVEIADVVLTRDDTSV